MSRAYEMLSRVLGETKAQEVVRGCLTRLGFEDVRTPEQLLAFGTCLADHGGFIEVVGRSVKVQALLSGARLAS